MGLISRIGLGAALCAAGLSVQAALVNSAFQSLGGNLWQASFTVSHDGAPAERNGLTIPVDADSFDALDQASAPAGWDPLILQPVGTSPWAYDVYRIDPGQAIAPGESLGGFSVRFAWLGTAGSPGELPFEIYRLDDDGGFVLEAEGFTQPAPVPAPASLWLALAGLGLLAAGSRRRAGRGLAQGAA